MKEINENCTAATLKKLTLDYKGYQFYSENIIRGKGVIQFSITKKLDI